MNVSSSGPSNKANIFLGLVEYELNSLLSASHLVDYISVQSLNYLVLGRLEDGQQLNATSLSL